VEKYSSLLLNVHAASDVRQTETHTAETLVPDPSPFKVKIAFARLKRYKSPGSNEIPAACETLQHEIHKLAH
jgi:hypothetical protein